MEDFQTAWNESWTSLGLSNASHLADVERVVVEAFDEERDGGRWQLLVVSEQQRQEADGDVLKLPRPWRQTRRLKDARHCREDGHSEQWRSGLTHMFLLLMELSRSAISCLYLLRREKKQYWRQWLTLVPTDWWWIRLGGVNLLSRLWVFDFLPRLTTCYFLVRWDGVLGKRLSSDHQFFSDSTALTGNLKRKNTLFRIKTKQNM